MCRRSWLVLLFTLVIVTLSTTLVLAQTQSFPPSPDVYKIKIAGCSSEPLERRQTGFRIKDKRGIVTALHGIIGCTTINAVSEISNEEIFNDLIIAEVDIDRDVALLWSENLAALPASGFDTITEPKDQDYQGIHVIGYPYGLPRQKPTTQITVTATTDLGNLISDDLVLALAKRSSPALWIKVLSVEGHLLPGHSGAPLLNNSEQVIGVADGGLDLGRGEITWAIPWHTIEWKPVSTQVPKQVSWEDVERLEKLDELENQALFTYPIPEGEKISSPSVLIDGGDYIQVVAAKGVNLRESPGTDQTRIDSATKGSILFIIEGSRNIDEVAWWHVRKIDGDQQGWVASAEKGTTLVQPIPKIGKHFHVLVTRSTGLNRFKVANSSSERIDVVGRGEILEVVGGPEENKGALWYQVRKDSNDEAGWVIFASNQGIYLEPVQGPAETPIFTVTPTVTQENKPITATVSPTSTRVSVPTFTPTPTPSFSELDWVTEQVRISPDIHLKWTECSGEPKDFCVRWNMYKDNDGVPVEMEILHCRQDGAWLDDRDMERYGLDIGIYKRVSGITIRRDCQPAPPTSDSVDSACTQLAPVTLGNQNTTVPVFVDVTTRGECRIFSHSPTGTAVRYDSIAVDDYLEDVKLVCGNVQEELKDKFTSFRLSDEVLDHWRSSQISLEPGCRIDFTVRDVKGDNIGLMIKSAEISSGNPTAPANPCIATERGPLTQGDHFLEGPLHVVQLWRANGNSKWGQSEVMALVYGDVSIIAAGGNVWTYPTQDCARGAEVDMQSSANVRHSTIVTVEELRAEGMIKTTSTDTLRLLTPTPTTIIPSTATIKRAEVAALTVGEASKEQVTDCLAKVHAGPRSFKSFAADEEIPSGALVATNYGEVGRDWHDFPVKPVCHWASWGLFETSSGYTAPYEGAYWMILDDTPIITGSPILCVPDGVIDHETANPLYKSPAGYRSGWITSDPSDLVLPDGTTTTILERYVLLVSDVSQVQIRNVAVGSKHSNTWGCWFRQDLTDRVLPAAEEELRKMKLDAPTVAAGLYRLDRTGLTKISVGAD